MAILARLAAALALVAVIIWLAGFISVSLFLMAGGLLIVSLIVIGASKFWMQIQAYYQMIFGSKERRPEYEVKGNVIHGANYTKDKD